MDSFTHVLVDDEGHSIRKFRWTVREAKWYRENKFGAQIVTLKKPKKENTLKKVLDDFTKEFGDPPF